MNSKQRRKYKRMYKHTVTLINKPEESWTKYDARVDAGIDWCKTNCDEEGFKIKHLYGYTEYYFVDGKQATLFALRFA